MSFFLNNQESFCFVISNRFSCRMMKIKNKVTAIKLNYDVFLIIKIKITIACFLFLFLLNHLYLTQLCLFQNLKVNQSLQNTWSHSIFTYLLKIVFCSPDPTTNSESWDYWIFAIFITNQIDCFGEKTNKPDLENWFELVKIIHENWDL